MTKPHKGSETAQSTATTIRILVVDDQALVRMGNSLMLDAADDLEVIGEAASGEEAVRAVRELQPTSYSWMCECRALAALSLPASSRRHTLIREAVRTVQAGDAVVEPRITRHLVGKPLHDADFAETDASTAQ